MVVVVLLALVCLCSSAAPKNVKDERSTPQIAVVGAGIGGTSAAYYLRELFGKDALIDIYEANDIGGRFASVEVGGRHYESGASIFHPENQYLVNFTKLLGLNKRVGVPSTRLGLFDGKGFPFTQSRWPFITFGKIIWRYGMDLFNINSYVTEMIENYSRIYQHQEVGTAFTTVEKLLNSMCPQFLELTKVSTRQHLTDVGLSKAFIDEFVTAALRVNYGQDANTQAFVGSMSIAGIQPGLWAVAGGNKMIPQKLVTRSKVKVKKAKVTKVKALKDGMKNYEIFYETQADKLSHEYDIVIMAAPLSSQVSGIKFEGFQNDIPNIEIPYHRTVATFLKGVPNITYFGAFSPEDFTDQILSINFDTFYNSFARNYPVDYTVDKDKDTYSSQVFKVFSQTPLSDIQKGELFLSHAEEQVVDWLAYPHYTSSQDYFPPFVLSDNLYYINSIEAASSAAEMVVIGARNVANLAYNFWNNLSEQNDKFELLKPSLHKTEL